MADFESDEQDVTELTRQRAEKQSGVVLGAGARQRAERQSGMVLEASALPLVEKVVVRDNKPFLERVNESVLIGALKRPTKTVVVSQDPAPGEQVPLGTAITLTLTVKDVIPLDSLSVKPEVAATWATIGALQTAIDSAPNANVLKQVLARSESYEELSNAETAVLDTFFQQVEGELTPQAKAQVFEDVRFAFQL